MNNAKKDKSTERFYRLSYLVIPLPMIAGAIFAVYVLLTEDERTTSYCAVAQSAEAYQKETLTADDFVTLEKNTLDLCKEQDQILDQDDGRLNGQVRWFICSGTSCGPGWQRILKEK